MSYFIIHLSIVIFNIGNQLDPVFSYVIATINNPSFTSVSFLSLEANNKEKCSFSDNQVAAKSKILKTFLLVEN